MERKAKAKKASKGKARGGTTDSTGGKGKGACKRQYFIEN